MVMISRDKSTKTMIFIIKDNTNNKQKTVNGKQDSVKITKVSIYTETQIIIAEKGKSREN